MNVGFLSGPAVMKEIGEKLVGVISRIDELEKARKGDKKEDDSDCEKSPMAKLEEMVKTLSAKVETLAIAKGDEVPAPSDTPAPEPQGSSEGSGTTMEDAPAGDNEPEQTFEKNNNEPPVFQTGDLWGGLQKSEKK